MSFLKRLPDWFREDELTKSINDETEEIKVHSYYDLLRQYVRQPLQLWAKYNKEDIVINRSELRGNESVTIDNTGNYPVMPSVAIKDYTCCTTSEAITGPITFSDGTRTLIIDANIPPAGTLTIEPPGNVKINGESVEYKNGVEQTINDDVIPFGKVHLNKKLKQIFTPTSTKTRKIEIQLGGVSAAPNDNIIIELWSVDNGELETMIKSMEITSETIYEMYAYSSINIELDEPLELKEHAIVVKRTQMQDDINYYYMNGIDNPTSSIGLLSLWDGVEWVDSTFNLYLIEKIPVISGEYPTIFENGILTIDYDSITPSSDDDAEMEVDETGITFRVDYEAISLDSIYVRGMAFIAYPLKKIQCYIGDTLLEEVKFIKEKKQYCYLMKIDADDIPDGLVDDLPFSFWATCSWHYFDKIITHGYPQEVDAEDINFQPNDLLDRVAKDKGLFRREYKTNIPYYEYSNTYPMGYPFAVEQDYCLEKRLLNEYVSTEEHNNEVFIKDDDGLELINLRSKKFSSYRIVCMMINIENETHELIPHLEVKYTNELKEEFTETFIFTSSRQMTRLINETSNILTAKLINYSTNVAMYKPLVLYPEGIYRRYGLVESEVFGYLGVIPTIKDMYEYCSIWDVNEWDYYDWGGDIYDAGVFRVDIPYPLPSNFKHLTNPEINTILQKCKSLGTHVLSAYSHTLTQDINPTISGTIRGYSGVLEQTLPIQLKMGNLSQSFYQPIITASVDLMEIDYTRQMNLNMQTETHGALFYPTFELYTKADFDQCYLTNAIVSQVGGRGQISINETYHTDAGGARSAWVENRNPTGWLWWSNLSGIYGAGAAVSGTGYYVNSTVPGEVYSGWPETDGLCVGNFNVDIPDDAIITGLKFRWSSESAQPTQPLICRCNFRTPKGNGTGAIATGSNWQEWEIGGNLNTFGINGLIGEDIKSNDFSVMMYFGGVQPGYNVKVDWVYLTVYYRPRAGSFLTPTIKKIAGAPTMTWGNLENISTGTVLYDVLQENKSFGNNQNEMSLESHEIWNQTIKLLNNKVCGIGIYSNGVNGNPTGSIKLTLCLLDSSYNIVTRLGSSMVTADKWSEENGNEVIFPIDLSGLDLSQNYGILLEPIGDINRSDYCEIGCTNTNVYINGKLRILQSNLSGIDYNGGNADLCFNVYSPIILKAGLQAPVSLSNIPYQNIKIRGNLFLTANQTPRVMNIKLDREVKYV